MENELKLIPSGKPVSIQSLRPLAERVADEANEKHKAYFNNLPVYKIRSDMNVGVSEANAEFCVSISEAQNFGVTKLRIREGLATFLLREITAIK